MLSRGAPPGPDHFGSDYDLKLSGTVIIGRASPRIRERGLQQSALAPSGKALWGTPRESQLFWLGPGRGQGWVARYFTALRPDAVTRGLQRHREAAGHW